MAIGWGDWGLRLVDAAADNAGLGKSSDGLVAVPEVDPRYEAIQRRQEARKLKRDVSRRHEEAAREKRFSGGLDFDLYDAAGRDVVSQYEATKRDSQALNRAFSTIGAPIRSYQNFSNTRRNVDIPYLDGESMGSHRFDSKYIDNHPGSHRILGTVVNDPFLKRTVADNARSAGHFVSREPYDKAGYAEYYRVLDNPFDMKRVPSSGLWAKGEWAAQNPELAAKRWLPPAFKNAIWGR